MNPAPLFLVAGLCLAFTLLLFFVCEQRSLRAIAARRDFDGDRDTGAGER